MRPGETSERSATSAEDIGRDAISRLRFVANPSRKLSLSAADMRPIQGGQVREFSPGAVGRSRVYREDFIAGSHNEALCLWMLLSSRSISTGVPEKSQTPVLKRMLGRDIRSIREDRCLTLETVAERSGLHHTTIQKIESGGREPRAKTLMLLAKGLGVPPGLLLEGDAWNHVNRASSA